MIAILKTIKTVWAPQLVDCLTLERVGSVYKRSTNVHLALSTMYDQCHFNITLKVIPTQITRTNHNIEWKKRPYVLQEVLTVVVSHK